MSEDLNHKLDVIASHLKSLDDYTKLSFKNLLKSFSLGLAGALGATVGLAIIVSLLTFIAKEAGGVPGIGRVFTDFGYYLRTK